MHDRIPSLRDFLARFLEGVDDPSARLPRGGRLAALGFITGAITAFAVNLVLTGFSLPEQFLALLVLALGIACLRINWERTRAAVLYLMAALAMAIIAVASVLSTPAYGLTYFFVAMVVAVAAPFKVLVGVLGAITIGLLIPATIGPNAGEQTLAFAMLCATTVAVMSVLASRLIRMLERSRQAFWTMSRQDPLTGIGNYRSLRERIVEEVGRHLRHRRSFSVIVLDLDHFKEINDRHGHLYGDQVLKVVAEAIRAAVRTEDTVFRQGGDEYAVVAPETVVEDVGALIERIADRVEGCGDGYGTVLTVSAGVATFPDDGATPDELIGAADDRLMSVKRSADPVM